MTSQQDNMQLQTPSRNSSDIFVAKIMAPAAVIQPIISVGQIDDVQELRKNKPTLIPDRFVRNKTERPGLSQKLNNSPSSFENVPIIDFSKLQNIGNIDDFHTEVLKLSTSCQEWGFFQVINHGVEVSLLESIDKLSKEFFMLPLEEKNKYPMAPGTVQGYGQAFVFSEDQKLDWCNMFALGIIPHSIRNPKLWPTKPTNFCETLEEYSKEIRKVCKSLLKYIAISLKLKDENVFEEIFGEAVQAVRMNYYPPCPRPDLVLGLSPHSDGSALTVLQQGQDNPVGLQILNNNMWVPINPIPNALVINIGDTIEVLSNGRYKSVEHRAVTNKEKDRLSIVTFYAPSYEVDIGPLQELVEEDNKVSKYRSYNHGEYSKHYVTNKLQGKKSLDFAKITTHEEANDQEHGM